MRRPTVFFPCTPVAFRWLQKSAKKFAKGKNRTGAKHAPQTTRPCVLYRCLSDMGLLSQNVELWDETYTTVILVTWRIHFNCQFNKNGLPGKWRFPNFSLHHATSRRRTHSSVVRVVSASASGAEPCRFDTPLLYFVLQHFGNFSFLYFAKSLQIPRRFST